MLALTAGMPAIADDTELLLAVPPPNNNPKPNMMFILDTSGSMDTEETTTVPYDSTQPYGGACDVNRVYWTDIDVLPDCATSNRWVDDANFHCAAAANQLAGIGSYSDTMVQWRDGGKGALIGLPIFGLTEWQYLAPGYNAPIECQLDSGKHGDGRATYLWASSASNVSDSFTNDPAGELSWGSAPRNLAYTVYDGNYLNWKQTGTTADIERIDIVKAVVSAVMKSITNVNVGIQRFNDEDGGTIIQGLTDIDANRTSVLNAIDSLTADGATPLSEVMYETALYWRGMDAYYGERFNVWPTDPGALDVLSPENYEQPPTNVCSKNYNIMLSDGQPNNDAEALTLTPTLPGITAALGRTPCDGTGDGACLDDITEYLSKEDIDIPLAGDQFVTTHTIGFAQDIPVLRTAAERSGGTYFQADDVETLATALLDIVGDITARNLSFSAPAVSVNAFNRTQNLNDLYLTVFSPKTRAHWPGNLKKYRISGSQIVDSQGLGAVNPATGFLDDAAQSFWTVGGPDGNEVTLGGAANILPLPVSRNLYTNNGASADLTVGSNALTPANAGAYTVGDFGLTGSTGEPTVDEVIRWMRGEDVNDEDFDPATTVRYAMGDPLHSQPAAVVYGGSAAAPDVVVYTATNDGYLHAVDGITGVELWSFVPKELLGGMARLFFDPRSKYKIYGIDGDVIPVVKDQNKNGIIDGSDFVYIVFGLRRGGDNFYALDVTNKNAPKLLWNRKVTGGGQSWSRPSVARVDINTAGQNADKAVVVVGGGYDSVHDTRAHPATADNAGAGLHMLDLVSGAELWRAGRDVAADTQVSAMTRSIPNQVRIIDLSGDGLADRMYASDSGGQLLRFDIDNGQSPGNLVAGGVIAQLGAEGLGAPGDADTRRFYNAPDASMFEDVVQSRRYISLSIGSGYRAHPLDNTASDRFYSVRDPDVFNSLTQAEYNSYDIITESDLIEVSGSVRTVIDSTWKGWKFTMPGNQKVIAGSVTFDDSVYFVGFAPETNLADICQPSTGRNWLYRVSVINGDPVVNNLDTLAATDADNERVEDLQQGGIAPTPAFLFPSPEPDCVGAACSPPPIFCVGAECNPSGFPNNPVRTLWTQDGIQ